MKLHQSAGIPVIVCSQLATRQAGFVLSGLLLPASAFVLVFFLSCSVFVEPEVQNMRTYPGEEPEQTRSKLLSARLKPGVLTKAGRNCILYTMARQTGEIKITGTIEHLVFYKMHGAYYIRMKSSLSSKRFWKDEAFEGSRKSCTLLSRASRLASLFYKSHPKQNRAKGLFNEMTGRVKLWLKEGKEEQEVLLLLKENYPVPQKKVKKRRRRLKEKAIALKDKQRLFRVLAGPGLPSYAGNIKKSRLYCLRE